MRARWFILAALGLSAACDGCNSCNNPSIRVRDDAAAANAANGRVSELHADRTEHDALGRRGDLVLEGSNGTRLTIATLADEQGRRPLRGSIVDLSIADHVAEGDSLLWWRVGVVRADHSFVAATASTVARMRCEGGGEGVKIVGDADTARIETHLCARGAGAFEIESRVLRGMPEGGSLADELNTGAVVLFADRVGSAWEERAETPWLAWGAHGVGAALEFDRARVVARKVIQIEAETFRAEARVRWESSGAVRTLHVARGDALSAMAHLRGAQRRATVRFADARGGTVIVNDAQGRAIGTFERAERAAQLTVPESFGASVTVRDHVGITRVSAQAMQGTIALANTPMGVIRATFVDEQGSGAPTKIIVRGIDGTADPTFVSSDRRFAAHSTMYALDGWAELPVRAGRYRVIATRGPAFSLVVREVTVADGAVVEVRETVAREVDTSGYIASDLHLHAAPSPDSSVSLPARVASLVCNGIEFAVATDHNAVTDYQPAVRALGMDRWIATVAGDELTTSGEALGHFNVFPLAGRGHQGALAYHNVTAEQIVRSARQAGASVLQVNHARMAPNIGYFAIAEFDARTGHGGPRFAGGFDAFEAFNGMYLERPERVREGVHDVIGLARAGIHAGVTGNSDSHHLVFEEAGWPRTWARADGRDLNLRPTRVMEAVRSGHTTVSSGPLVELWVENMQPGDTVLRPGGARRVRARVRVRAARWIPVERVELWVNDRVAFEAPVPPLPEGAAPAANSVRFERTFDLSLDADAAIIAWASAEQPLPHVLPPYPNARAIGFTGPVFVDATGDANITIAAAE
jgi:hypothetical protein